jgi:hypothetical protein
MVLRELGRNLAVSLMAIVVATTAEVSREWRGTTQPTISPFVSLFEGTGAQLSLAPHDVKNVYALAFLSIENPTGGLNNLSITPALELGRLRTAVRMSR